MDQFSEEKTTEKNLIVRSGIFEAKTTNNKRLLDVFYWSYTDTKHRTASLRQQSFLFNLFVFHLQLDVVGPLLWIPQTSRLVFHSVEH